MPVGADAGADLRPSAGLTTAEAARRLAADGPNALPQGRSRSLLGHVLDAVREPMIALLFACGAVYMVLGSPEEALALLAAVVAVTGITVWQERRTERAVAALRDLTAPRALVVRDGAPVRIAGRDVVRGDLVLLGEGDRVPADAQAVEAFNLFCDESMLTGESEPVSKAADASLAAGTLVVRGRAAAVVTATGRFTEIGRIGRSLETLDTAPSPLQAEIRTITGRAAVGALALSAVTALVVAVSRGTPAQGVLQGLTLAMAILPEEFPVVLATFLALGALRLARERVLVRHVAAVETLGAATVLCSDKTGTITENRMGLAAAIAFVDGKAAPACAPDALAGRAAAVVAAAARAGRDDGFDPMESALRRAAASLNARVDDPVRLEYPFAATRPVTGFVRGAAPAYSASLKGAPEVVAALCGADAALQAAVNAAVHEAAAAGYRVLGVAEATVSDPPPADVTGPAWRFLGLVALVDPVRAGVPEAVAECRAAGIRPVVITGDHAATARAVAARIGLDGAVLTGADLDAVSDDALARALTGPVMFARTRPEHKLRIVQVLVRMGEVVAMTGDGVNDAPALKAAPFGEAMGLRGTDTARETAHIVLTDDDFGAIVGAVRLGRRVYDNLRRSALYIVACHMPIAGMALWPVFAGLAPMLGPLHVLFLELVIDPACSIAFEAEPAAPDVMQRPPRGRAARLFATTETLWAVVRGASVLAATAAIYAWGLGAHDVSEGRAMAFAALVAGNVGLIGASRIDGLTARPMDVLRAFSRPNRALTAIVATAAVALPLVTAVPAVVGLTGGTALPVDHLLVACAAAFAAAVVPDTVAAFVRAAGDATRSA